MRIGYEGEGRIKREAEEEEDEMLRMNSEFS